MVVKKVSGKTDKRSTSSAMSDILNRQKKSTKAIEKMVGKNIAAEIATSPPGKLKEKPLKDIAVEVAARRRAQSAPKKGKAEPKTKSKPEAAKGKAPKAEIKKSRRSGLSKAPGSTRRPASKKRAAKARPGKSGSIKVVTIGAGLYQTAGAGVSALFHVVKVLNGFVSSGVVKAVESAGTGARSAKEKVKGVIKSVNPGDETKNKKAGNGAVAAARKTASGVTGKVAGGFITVGSGVGKVAGYVLTGALAAPVDIVSGVIGAGASATSSVSRLLFGPPKSKRAEPVRRKKIPVV